MITPKRARKLADEWVAKNRPHCFVTALYEDDADYFPVLDTEYPEFPLTGSWMFISKETGHIWEEAYGLVFNKVEDMTLVKESPTPRTSD